MIEREKVYFLPGDVVSLRQEIPNRPEMYVVKKVTKTIRLSGGKGSDYLQGILCRWFALDMTLQEAIFNTKDLIKL